MSQDSVSIKRRVIVVEKWKYIRKIVVLNFLLLSPHLHQSGHWNYFQRPASRSSLDMEPVRDCGHIRSSPMERHIHVQSSSGERKRNERSPPREKKRKNNNISVERKRNGSHSPGEKKRNRKGKAHHDIKTMNESQNITDLPEQMSISYTPSEAEQMSTGKGVILISVLW